MYMIAAMAFTNPLLLAGMSLAALPVIAHLLNRRARRKIVFPTVRLLRESLASQSKLYRLRRWILLALRCLAIFLVAWAFARPVWQDRAAAGESADAGAALVIVADLSASAAQQADGISVIGSMKALAGRALDSLAEGTDLANVVYAQAKPRAAFPQLSNNFAALRQEIDRLSPTQERADLPEAFALAGEFLKGHAGAKRLVVLSDMQRTNWSDVTLKGQARQLLPAGTRITIMPVPAPSSGNAALWSPRAVPVQPIVGRPFALQVRVANFSDRPRAVPVEATLEGRSLGRQEVTLKPWEERDVSFEAKADSAGSHAAAFTIPPDGLAADNQAFGVVQAVARIPVAVVGDDNPNQQGGATYFLSRALAPRGDMGDDLEVRHLTGRDLSFGRIRDVEAVFVGAVGQLPPEALRALYMYVNQGGGVAFFCGEGPVAENMLAFGALARQGDCLPWLPTGQRDLSGGGGVLQLGEGDFRRPRLADFDEPGREGLRHVRFFRVWLSGAMKPSAQSILRFSDGTPALAQQAVGSGKVVLANFSPALRCSDIGKYGSFVALMHAMADSLRPRQDWRGQALAGEALTVTVPEAPG
ncbi:MAG: BatA and WFA domain-containing protein, partial [Planctomycetota bacterium]|nr:BatA and WFA domain-containing protein [Planctomycetota bacterium]